MVREAARPGIAGGHRRARGATIPAGGGVGGRHGSDGGASGGSSMGRQDSRSGGSRTELGIPIDGEVEDTLHDETEGL